MNMSVVDLFCGAGGLTHGFLQEKFHVTAGLDFDLTCKYPFETNNDSAKFIHANISKIKSKDINALFPKNHKKILVGCAPCQPFSLYAHARKPKDGKWKLLYSFLRIIRDIKPDIISMENVPQLVKYDNGKVFDNFVNGLKNEGYYVNYHIVNAQDYGVPQRRKRLILLASLYGEIKLLPPTHKDNPVVVKKAIGHLPPIEDGEYCAHDKLHYSRKLNEMNIKRIKATSPGGSWKSWDESLILDCHKKESGKAFGSVYGRMRWDDVSPTITTCCVGLGNGRYGHPEQHRAISLREAALLQSFPAKYDFIDNTLNFSSSRIARYIGNAVPVRLGRIIARSIRKHLQQYD
jgi:DNA (cytosine-5)-methyltransferase 1